MSFPALESRVSGDRRIGGVGKRRRVGRCVAGGREEREGGGGRVFRAVTRNWETKDPRGRGCVWQGRQCGLRGRRSGYGVAQLNLTEQQRWLRWVLSSHGGPPNSAQKVAWGCKSGPVGSVLSVPSVPSAARPPGLLRFGRRCKGDHALCSGDVYWQNGLAKKRGLRALRFCAFALCHLSAAVDSHHHPRGNQIDSGRRSRPGWAVLVGELSGRNTQNPSREKRAQWPNGPLPSASSCALRRQWPNWPRPPE
jgi:hypothetical protein